MTVYFKTKCALSVYCFFVPFCLDRFRTDVCIGIIQDFICYLFTFSRSLQGSCYETVLYNLCWVKQ